MTVTTRAHWSVGTGTTDPVAGTDNWTTITPPTVVSWTMRGDHPSGIVTIPAGRTLRSMASGAYLISALGSDDIPAKQGTPVVQRVRITLSVPAGAEPSSATIGLQLPNCEGVTVPVVPAGATAGAANGVGAVSVTGVPVVAGVNTYNVEVRGTVLPGKSVVYANASLRLLYGTSGGPTVATEAVITGSVDFAEFDTEPPAAGGGAPGANVLHFRDPADGKFKPLTEVRVRGVADAAPDLSAAGIKWGTDNLIHVDWSSAVLEHTFPAAANLRTTPDADGITLAWDAFNETLQWTGGQSWAQARPGGTGGFTAKFTVPVSKAHGSLPQDDRAYGAVGRAENPAGYAANAYWRFSLFSDETPARYGFFDFRPNAVRAPMQPSNQAAIMLRLDGTNPRMEVLAAKSSYKRDTPGGEAWADLATATYVSGTALPVYPTNAPAGQHETVMHWAAGSVHLTGAALTMQEVVAP